MMLDRRGVMWAMPLDRAGTVTRRILRGVFSIKLSSLSELNSTGESFRFTGVTGIANEKTSL